MVRSPETSDIQDAKQSSYRLPLIGVFSAMREEEICVMMNQTGHRSSATLRRYIRDDSLFTDNAASRLGL